MTEVEVFTRAEVARRVRYEFDRFREELRGQAHDAFGDSQRMRRAALLEVLFNLDPFRDDVLARFGVDVPDQGGARFAAPVGSAETETRLRANQGHHVDRWAS